MIDEHAFPTEAFVSTDPACTSAQRHMVRVWLTPTRGRVYMDFRGGSEDEARTAAKVFIAGERKRFQKSLMAVEARRQGRSAQKLERLRSASETRESG